eukprot:10174888-Alexandrium_andersonii.AAC.1
MSKGPSPHEFMAFATLGVSRKPSAIFVAAQPCTSCWERRSEWVGLVKLLGQGWGDCYACAGREGRGRGPRGERLVQR